MLPLHKVKLANMLIRLSSSIYCESKVLFRLHQDEKMQRATLFAFHKAVAGSESSRSFGGRRRAVKIDRLWRTRIRIVKSQSSEG